MSQNIDPIVVEPTLFNELESELEEKPIRLRKLKRMIEAEEENEGPEEIKMEKKTNFGTKLKKMAEIKHVIDKVEELIVEETDKPAKKKPRKIKNKETAKIQAETKNIDQVSTQEKEDLNESVVQGKKLKKKINNIKIDEDQEKRGQKFLSVFSATESEKEEENENQQNEKLEGDYEPKENAIMIQASDEEKDEATPLKPKKRKLKKLNESVTEIIEEDEVKPKTKRIRKLKKIEDNDYDSIINEEEKNLEVESAQTEKPKKPKKNDTDKTKVKQSKPQGESTQTIFEKMRLDPTFALEEESDKDSADNVNDIMLPNKVFGVKKEKAKKTDHHIIKTRNKFFKEINTLETPQIDEAPNFEEEYVETRDLIVEHKIKNKSKATIENFLSKLQIYREEHTTPAAMNSQNRSNLDPAIADGKNDIVVPRQGDVFNMDNENKEYAEKQSRPHALLKSSSLELSKFLNNTLSNFSIEEDSNMNLQISIPSQGKGNHVHESTLFVNKLARSNSVLNKTLLTSGGLEKKISGSSSERELYRSQLLEEVRKRKSKHINVMELHERFKQTEFSELTAEKRRKTEKNEENTEMQENQNNIETIEGQDVDPTSINNNNVDSSTQPQPQVLDFMQMIALEEGIEEEEEESQMEEGEDTQEQNDETKNLNENKNMEENTKLSEKTPNKNSNEMVEEKNDYDDGEETLEETRVLKKLRKLANTFSEKYNIDKQKVEKKITKSMQDPRIKQMLQKMFEVEAELGSDNEENDEMVKQINKKDDDENDSEGEMDEELRQMIDNDVEFDEKDEEKLMDKFYKDLLKEDRENLKKVMQRAYLAGNKRRNADFGIDENDMMKRKTDMINERIKLIEDRESMYNLNEESTKNQKSTINFDIFEEKEEENMIKMREINSRIRKEVEKKMPKIDESQILDKNIVFLLNPENQTINLKENIQNKYENKNKLLNSVLQVKNNKNNISIFNNAYNKDIVNEFGSKISIFENLKKRELESHDNKQVINNDKNISSKPQMSSLNRLFSQRNNKEFNRPSPNKVFVFGFKK